MNFQEKKLYHQIHPVKLLTDWLTGVIALCLLWFHHLLPAVLVMFIPSIVVSLVIVKYANLNKLKESSFGTYIQRSMTKVMEIVRFLGFAMMILGAWCHLVWLIIIGLMVILYGWLYGMITTR